MCRCVLAELTGANLFTFPHRRFRVAYGIPVVGDDPGSLLEMLLAGILYDGSGPFGGPARERRPRQSPGWRSGKMRSKTSLRRLAVRAEFYSRARSALSKRD